MKLATALVALFFLMGVSISHAQIQSIPTNDGALIVELSTVPTIPVPGEVVLKINFVNPTTKQTQVHIDYSMQAVMNDQVYGAVENSHTSEGKLNIPVMFDDEGEYTVTVTASGIFFQPITPQSAMFSVYVGADNPSVTNDPTDTMSDHNNGGGCLIATAAYGTELAPQIQRIREIRDNVVMNTESGNMFMSWFNNVYYTFSPTVADLERQNPHFKSAVALGISPMIATLGLFEESAISDEASMISYGIGIIALNLGIYAGVPFLAIFGVRRFYGRHA